VRNVTTYLTARHCSTSAALQYLQRMITYSDKGQRKRLVRVFRQTELAEHLN